MLLSLKKKKKKRRDGPGTRKSKEKIHPHSIFSPFWGKKYFSRLKEKTLGPHHLFSFILTQLNTP